jgi:hypothetical protein
MRLIIKEVLWFCWENMVLWGYEQIEEFFELVSNWEKILKFWERKLSNREYFLTKCKQSSLKLWCYKFQAKLSLQTFKTFQNKFSSKVFQQQWKFPSATENIFLPHFNFSYKVNTITFPSSDKISLSGGRLLGMWRKYHKSFSLNNGNSFSDTVKAHTHSKRCMWQYNFLLLYPTVRFNWSSLDQMHPIRSFLISGGKL